MRRMGNTLGLCEVQLRRQVRSQVQLGNEMSYETVTSGGLRLGGNVECVLLNSHLAEFELLYLV